MRNRSGPHIDTSSEARRPKRAALGLGESGDPSQSRRDLAGAVRVEPCPGGRLVPRHQGFHAPARSETRNGSPHAAASLTTRPHGSIRLGWTKAEANAYQRGNSSAWRKPGRWIASAQPLRRTAASTSRRARTVAAEDQVPRRRPRQAPR